MADPGPLNNPRTKAKAVEVLHGQVRALRRSVEDSTAADLLTEVLAADVLEVAWRHQFDDDRGDCTRKIRAIVEIAIEESEIGLSDATPEA